MSITIKKGKQREPLFLMIYGAPGIGKTTFASQAPRPIFIGNEENKEFAVDKITITSSKEMLEAINHVKDLKDYESVVIDSLSMYNKMCIEELIKADKSSVKSIHNVAGGYGRGTELLAQKDKELVDALKTLLSAGKNVILTCHSAKDVEEDATLQVTRIFFRPAIEKKSLLVWEMHLPIILFARDHAVISEKDKTVSVGNDRVIYTEYRQSHHAKNRYGLPYSMKLDKSTMPTILKHHRSFYADGVTTNKDESLKDIWKRIPASRRPNIDWSKINKNNEVKARQKLLELL